MLLTHVLVTLATLSALGSSGAPVAAPECIQMDLNPMRTLCVDQPTSLSLSVSNACSTSKRVTLTFAVDHEAIREKAPIVVAPLETLAQRVLLPLPSSVRSGLHTLTVSVKDAAGNVRSTDFDLTVASCDVPVASVRTGSVERSSEQKE